MTAPSSRAEPVRAAVARVRDALPHVERDAARTLRRTRDLAVGAVGVALAGPVRVGAAALSRLRDGRNARVRELRRRGRQPLPSLYDLHPEARSFARREVGLRSIPLDEIAGTAVAGAPQRGGDFLPLPDRRSTNWEYRWQAIERAMNRLVVLPPIDVLRFDGRYWVEDGHNRVAAALYHGQVEIDATVTELRPIGAHPTEHPTELAPVIQDSQQLRAAAAGRFHASAAEAITKPMAPTVARQLADAAEVGEDPPGGTEGDGAEGDGAEGGGTEGGTDSGGA